MVLLLSFIELIISMQCFREREKEEGRCNMSTEEKMKSIPGSIYLPRKHFPTKQKYHTERERETHNQRTVKAHKQNN